MRSWDSACYDLFSWNCVRMTQISQHYLRESSRYRLIGNNYLLSSRNMLHRVRFLCKLVTVLGTSRSIPSCNYPCRRRRGVVKQIASSRISCNASSPALYDFRTSSLLSACVSTGRCPRSRRLQDSNLFVPRPETVPGSSSVYEIICLS